MNKKLARANNNIMEMNISNLEDNETFFKKQEDIDGKPIEEKIFQDGIKEILEKQYD